MKFNELNAKMRVYETAHDHCVLPGLYMIARLDGRGFTRLTREVHPFEAPFDEKFRDSMILTVEHLMNCGLKIIYGYTQSDEISLLFDIAESAFNRKLRYSAVFVYPSARKLCVGRLLNCEKLIAQQ
ncbi:MAG: tRNA(His) guanylyltransferase Thg1 family protein [Coleofasciculus sp. G3-WIS-01]